MNKFKDKVVWITGASSGIGRALAERFITLDSKIVLSGLDLKAMLEMKSSFALSDDRVLVLELDLEKIDNANELANLVKDHFGRIDYLLNIAGVSQRSFVDEVSMKDIRRIMEINFFGTVQLSKAVLRIMLEQNSGHIAATSSLVGKFGFPLRSAYASSKHAIHGFFESLRLENQAKGIKVSIIIPGRVKTNISINAIDKDGKSYGKLDDGQAGGISSEKAAIQIINGLRKGKKEILVGSKELLMLYLKRFLPRIHHLIASQIKST
jgi:short-subunit dehydrogenase